MDSGGRGSRLIGRVLGAWALCAVSAAQPVFATDDPAAVASQIQASCRRVRLDLRVNTRRLVDRGWGTLSPRLLQLAALARGRSLVRHWLTEAEEAFVRGSFSTVLVIAHNLLRESLTRPRGSLSELFNGGAPSGVRDETLPALPIGMSGRQRRTLVQIVTGVACEVSRDAGLRAQSAVAESLREIEAAGLCGEDGCQRPSALLVPAAFLRWLDTPLESSDLLRLRGLRPSGMRLYRIAKKGGLHYYGDLLRLSGYDLVDRHKLRRVLAGKQGRLLVAESWAVLAELVGLLPDRSLSELPLGDKTRAALAAAGIVSAHSLAGHKLKEVGALPRLVPLARSMRAKDALYVELYEALRAMIPLAGWTPPEA